MNFKFVLTNVLMCLVAAILAQRAAAVEADFTELVKADKPVAFWRFSGEKGKPVANEAPLGETPELLDGSPVGVVVLQQEGPRPKRYLAFDAKNTAAAFSGQRGFIRVKDPGDDSPLDFGLGDTITLEAWVNLQAIGDGQNIYIVGKGRTNNDGFTRENQNYALRLRGIGDKARVSFLFRNGTKQPAAQRDYHRWNSAIGFAADTGWHHLAVSYTFGKPKSIQGYLDGEPVPGTWDMGGPTADGPVTDNDDLWIGSSLGGSPNSTFNGLIDEVAIYRHALSAERIRERWRIDSSQPAVPEIELPEPPEGQVLVEIFEGLGKGSYFRPSKEAAQTITLPALAITDLPQKYNAKGLIADRPTPVLVRAITKLSLPAGEYSLMLRSKDQSRLRIDGRVVAQTKIMSKNASGHEHVPELAASDHPLLRPLTPGHQEQRATVQLDGGEHVVVLEGVVGTGGLRPEIGELVAAIGRDGVFHVLSPAQQIPLTDEAFSALAAEQQAWLHNLNSQLRKQAGREEAKYWQRRHEIARGEVSKRAPIDLPDVPGDFPVNNPIDQFISSMLAAENIKPAPLTSDWEFLRRVTLDTVGVIPTPAEIEKFQKDDSPRRRQNAIDRLLSDPRWADHWVGYWQDVLAENPNVLKGKLNNTGPFRYWIYESFLDNKPVDRFATELIMMEGSQWYGGPAGFAMATQNDVPMAAKAHIIGKAFLGVEMQCARCHDAPYHEVKQSDTFSVAAMLGRRGQKIPSTSIVPMVEGARRPEVTVSLKPGQVIQPTWPFDELADPKLPEGLLRNSDDTRARLAAIVSSPRNERFAEVVVNRLWARYMGRGIVQPVDDWETARPSHPQLLKWLARELVLHNYDLKHVARLILTSHAYQRKVVDAGEEVREQRELFATPTRRRMTAEQAVDSLFQAAGKKFRAEALTLDPEGRRPVNSFLNLGVPTRAWHFASLSNERDRPALALPVAQSIVDVLVTFGWRESRQDPITKRETEATALQPAVLANGLVGRRIVALSDDSALTSLALAEQSPSAIVDATFTRILSRPPSDDESHLFGELLRDGFQNRRKEVVQKPGTKNSSRHAVSWSNHLSPEATRIKLELEAAARRGDPPTARLDSDWRERMEDMVWALVNSPEFMFVP